MKNLYQIESYMAWIVAIVLTFQLVGCDNERGDQGLWRAKAALAIAEAEQLASTHQSPSRNESAARDELSKPKRRILYFGARFCPACRVAEESLERLAEAGWRIGPEADNHIQTFTIGETAKQQALAQEWNVNAVPTWILWENGEEMERKIGPLDPFEIGRLFGE